MKLEVTVSGAWDDGATLWLYSHVEHVPDGDTPAETVGRLLGTLEDRLDEAKERIREQAAASGDEIAASTQSRLTIECAACGAPPGKPCDPECPSVP